jgi:hypothetical protein
MVTCRKPPVGKHPRSTHAATSSISATALTVSRSTALATCNDYQQRALRGAEDTTMKNIFAAILYTILAVYLINGIAESNADRAEQFRVVRVAVID